MDDGKVKVIISYEDENGIVSTEEKEITLFVTEDESYLEDIDVGNFEDDIPMEEGGFLSAFLEKTRSFCCRGLWRSLRFWRR